MKKAKRVAPFGPELFAFLRDLAANNDRAWFLANKERYERAVRDPLLRFIEGFGPKLERISKHYLADPRPVGGSMFRLHRDTRFSRDKSPYKTHAAAQFRHLRGKDVHAPGFYLHLEPKNAFLGVGIWHPEAEALEKVRAALIDRGAVWKKAITTKSFTAVYELAGESLQRSPRGFDPDHPLIEEIKRKDFIGTSALSERDVVSPGFMDQVADRFSAARPMMRFLAEALGLPF
jgi:uncharacterized protein (TIGR02453 family)